MSTQIPPGSDSEPESSVRPESNWGRGLARGLKSLYGRSKSTFRSWGGRIGRGATAFAQSVRGWWSDIVQTFAAPKGWQFVGKTILLFAGGYGLLLTLLTYQQTSRMSEIDLAERAYVRLTEDLNSDNVKRQIDALHKIPEMMCRRTPIISRTPTVFEYVTAATGNGIPTTTPFMHDLKRKLHGYTTIDPQTSNASGANAGLSKKQFDAVIEVLCQLGYEGWYTGRVIQDEHVKLVDGIQWVWHAPPENFRYLHESPSTIFEETVIRSCVLSRFSLDNANFKKTRIDEGDFSYAKLHSANFAGGHLSQVDFSHTKLSDSLFDGATMDSVKLGNAELRFVSFRDTVMTGLSVWDCDLSGGNFIKAIISEGSFSNANAPDDAVSFDSCELKNVRFFGCNLQRCSFRRVVSVGLSFTNCNLENSSFALAHMSGVSFRDCNVEGVVFDRCDLRDGDLGAAKNILELRSALDANISGAKLEESARQYLIEKKGAIEIPDSEKWKSYKLDGTPHDRWRDYQ